MTGRPSLYSPELADKICELIADGKSLRTICQAEDMPNRGTVFRWLALSEAGDKIFSNQYACARQTQADVLFEEILEIADDGKNDTYTDDEGTVRTDHDVIARSRLRVDSRKWMAGKLRPKVYGDKLALGGADDLPPITVNRIELVAMRAGDSSSN